MEDNLPNCPCGRELVFRGGGYFGGDLTQRSVACSDSACPRVGVELQTAGICIIVNFAPANEKEALDWANHIFLKRIAAVELEAIREIRFEQKEIAKRPDVLIAKVPERVYVHQLLHNKTWRVCDSLNSADAMIPADPIRAIYRADWDQQFLLLENAIGMTIERIEIPNEYGLSETFRNPWHAFPLFKSRVRVGWRKRVIAIHWEPDFAPTLNELATKDTVTCGPGYVHAWGYEKFQAYMLALAQDLRRAHKQV